MLTTRSVSSNMVAGKRYSKQNQAEDKEMMIYQVFPSLGMALKATTKALGHDY
jgi:ABC-type branched-subunit amino acid transport system ATPase component